MSIENDLNAFHGLALEEQIRIPYYLEKYGNYSSVYANLDPILEEIVGDNRVAVTGEVYMPEIDDRGQFRGYHRLTDREMAYGRNYGVKVGPRADIDPVYLVEDQRLLVGYWVGLLSVNRNFVLEQGRSEFYAFAPVENSRLHIPELVVSESTIMPEPDDRMALYIDEALLNDPADFGKLVAIFNTLSNRPEIQIDYYLNYLNTILPLHEYSARVTSSSFIHDSVGEYIDIMDAETTFFSSELLPTNFEYLPDIDKLCISVDIVSVNDQHDRYYIPIDSITELRLTHHG